MPGLLLVRVGLRWCGLPLASVLETMRPLPVEPVPNTPDFVRGVSLIRGRRTPVVDLRLLFDGTGDAPPSRMVTVTDERTTAGPQQVVALLVDEVSGIRDVPEAGDHALPPLLTDATSLAVREISRLDAHLLTTLDAARILPDDVWPVIASERGA